MVQGKQGKQAMLAPDRRNWNAPIVKRSSQGWAWIKANVWGTRKLAQHFQSTQVPCTGRHVNIKAGPEPAIAAYQLVSYATNLVLRENRYKHDAVRTSPYYEG